MRNEPQTSFLKDASGQSSGMTTNDAGRPVQTARAPHLGEQPEEKFDGVRTVYSTVRSTNWGVRHPTFPMGGGGANH